MGQGAGAGPLAGLNTGAMAPLVVRPQPVDLPALTFTDCRRPGRVAGRFPRQDRAPQHLGHVVRALPGGDAGARQLETKLGGKDFQVVAVNIDKGGADKAAAFLKETGATHLALYTDPSGKLFATLKAVGMPTTLLIDRNGKEIARLVGPADWASAEAVKVIEAAIGAKASAS